MLSNWRILRPVPRNSIGEQNIDLVRCATPPLQPPNFVIDQCNYALDTIDLNRRWTISESLLSLFWDDAFVRIVTLDWMYQLYQGGVVSDSVTAHLQAGRAFPNRQNAYNNYDESLAYLQDMLSILLQDSFLSGEFRTQVIQPLCDYFGELDIDHPNPIPIRFLEGRGFDYILSNEGIDVILPWLPEYACNTSEFLQRMMSLYAIRETGSYAILVPPNDYESFSDFEGGGLGRAEVDAVRINPNRTVRNVSADNNIEEIRFSAARIAYAILTSPAIFVPGGVTIGHALLPSFYNGDDYIGSILEAGSLDIGMIGDELEASIGEFPDRNWLAYLANSPLRLCTFVWIHDVTRCWQLSGSVFRRIAHEVPRLMARMWRDYIRVSRLVDATLDAAIVAFLNSQEAILRHYERQYVDDGNLGCRNLFQERLEMTLPPSGRMVFCGTQAGAQPPRREIVISNYGIQLPTITSPPDRLTMMRAWKNGAAANPVFTDSSKTS